MPSGGSGGGSGTQTVTNVPWSGQQPYLTDLYKQAQTTYGQTGGGPNPNTQAGWENILKIVPTTQHGQNQIAGATDAAYQLSRGAGYTTIPEANVREVSADQSGFQTGNSTYDPMQLRSNIEMLQGLGPNFNLDTIRPALEASLEPLTRDLLTKALPAAQSQAAAQGAFGSRAAINMENVLGDYSRVAGDTLAREANNAALQLKGMETSNFGTLAGLAGSTTNNIIGNQGADFRSTQQLQAAQAEADAQRSLQAKLANQMMDMQRAQLATQHEQFLRQNQLQAAGMVPGMVGAGVNSALTPGQIQLQVGQQQQQNAWGDLNNYSSIIQGMNPGGTQTTTGLPTGASALQSGITGGLGGALIGGSFAPGGLAGLGAAGGMAAAAPWLLGGAAIGGLLGII